MRSRLVLAIALVVGCTPLTTAQETHPAQFSSRTFWSSADESFGGWSGIEVSADGSEFTAVSDRGYIISGRLLRNKRGWLVGAETGPMLTLTHTKGEPLPRFFNDSEGLAIAADGSVYVSFESEHRVSVYSDRTVDRAIDLPRAKDFARMQNNSSLEALAIAPDGSLYTLPERSGAMDRPFNVYRYRDGRWSVPFAIPRRGEFLPVGADIGPDGRFYLLERRLSSSQLGFASRVRRFDLGPESLSGETTLLVTQPRDHDNLEGIAVWQDDLGDMHLVMVSDDNHKFFQQNEIVEYVVPADAPMPADDPAPGDDAEAEAKGVADEDESL